MTCFTCHPDKYFLYCAIKFLQLIGGANITNHFKMIKHLEVECFLSLAIKSAALFKDESETCEA